jgi:hypothetical protein
VVQDKPTFWTMIQSVAISAVQWKYYPHNLPPRLFTFNLSTLWHLYDLQY